VENWYSGEILECAVYKIEVFTIATHTWVGMKARKHGILESLPTNAK
jgi:hypothetical protein